MAAILSCPGCRRRLEFPESHLGRLVRCAHCLLAFVADQHAERAAGISEPAAPPHPTPHAADDELAYRVSMLAQFKPGGKLAAAVKVLLGLILIVQAATFVSNVLQYELLRQGARGQQVDEEDINRTVRRQLALRVAYGAVYLPTPIVFLFWFRRVHANLRPLGAGELKYTSRMAVGIWFIPIYNLVCPPDVAQEIFRHSDPKRRVGASTRLITCWWLTWLLSGALSSFVSWRSQDAFHPLVLRDLAVVEMIANAVSLTACVLAMMIVTLIDTCQTARADALRNGVVLEE